MSSDYKVTSRSERYIAAAAAACRNARPLQTPYRFNPIDFIENVLMVDGVEAVWRNRGAPPKGKLSLNLFDSASKWDAPAEVSFHPNITLRFDRSLWAHAKAGHTHGIFVAAHEIGHVILHDITAKEFSSESEARISFRRADDESAEWQAHTFAGHLLLPTPIVQKIDDHDKLAFLCNAPDTLVAERLANVRSIKKILHQLPTPGAPDQRTSALAAGTSKALQHEEFALIAKRRKDEQMPKQPGLDGRHRDASGQIHQKMGNTKIGTLRQTYGDEFAAGHRSDMKLENLLKQTGANSLTDFLKNYN